MTGQVVDFFERDFCELYAVSEKLDLFKEFHVSPSAPASISRTRAESKRPPLPATTSRFQVSLGDTLNPNIQVPAHKYHNPKYLLALGGAPRPPGSLQEPGPRRGTRRAEVPEDIDSGRPQLASSEKMGQVSPVSAEAPSEIFQRPNGVSQDKKEKSNFWRIKSHSKFSADSTENSACPSPTETSRSEEIEDNFEVKVVSPSKWKSKKLLKLGRKTGSVPSVPTAHDNESKSVGMFNYYIDDEGSQVFIC